MKIRIGYGLGTAGLADDTSYVQIVDLLEQLGFDSIWLAERIAGVTVDPIVGLSVAAARTKRLKLGTGVLILPGRNPALLAKQIGTLDVLSNGRLLVAFGSGAAAPTETQVFGIPERDRGPWIDEVLPLLRRLWAGEVVDHDGPRFHYQALAVRPTTKQQPIDVWLGGSGPRALRRLGRLADGWLPGLCLPEEAAAGRAVIQEAAREAGRMIDPEHFGANLTYARHELPASVIQNLRRRRPDADVTKLVPVGYPALCERIREFVDVGCSKFVVRVADEPASWADELGALAEAILPLQT